MATAINTRGSDLSLYKLKYSAFKRKKKCHCFFFLFFVDIFVLFFEATPLAHKGPMIVGSSKGGFVISCG